MEENFPLKVIDNTEVISGLHLNYREVSHSILSKQLCSACCY
jgi:hypothetical protein